jgi:phenylpropionate dioxygenase-like ring-hydroxylating dioxygenase large terminal subunit
MFIGPSDLPGAPAGWYCVAFAAELKVGTVLTRNLAGHDVVIFRGQSGQIGMVDALCPHLGGHLGHGRVEDDCIRCPFHGFCFNGQGECERTGYGTRPPPRAKVRPWTFVEDHGMLLAWWHPEAQPPTWHIPEVSTENWTPVRWHTFEFKSHVQDIAENSVDIGHFAVVHDYQTVETLEPLRAEGPYLRANYAIKRPRMTMGMASPRVEMVIHQFGLGYARVEC